MGLKSIPQHSTGRQIVAFGPTVVIGLATATISLIRLTLGREDALTEVLWAEDGLFALCARDFPIFSCTFEPYAGYLNFAPRVVSVFVSLTTVDSWALAANLLSATLVGLAAAIVFGWIRRNQSGFIVACMCALLPVLLPIFSTEAINSMSNYYMILIYTLAVTIALPPSSRNERYFQALLLFLTALSTPLAILVAPWFLWSGWRSNQKLNEMRIPTIGLLLGVLLQLTTMLRSQTWSTSNREIDISQDFGSRVFIGAQELFEALVGSNDTFTVNSHWALALALSLTTGFVFIMSLYQIFRGTMNARWSTASFTLIGLGVCLLLFLGIVTYPNNRYLITPSLLFVSGILLFFNNLSGRLRSILSISVSLALLALWTPHFPASDFRTQTTIGWSKEVQRLVNFCAAKPDQTVPVKLAPFWFTGHTHSGAGPIIHCRNVKNL